MGLTRKGRVCLTSDPLSLVQVSKLSIIGLNPMRKEDVQLESIASRLKEVRGRRSARLIAADVAPFLDREPSHSSILDYEKGTDPPATYVAAFCRALGVSPEWVLLGRGPRISGRESVMTVAFQVQEAVVRLAADEARSEDELLDLFRRGLDWLRGEAPAGA